MSTRGADTRLLVLPKSPGPEYLTIRGRRLPTYEQVLLCLLSHLETRRKEDASKNVPLLQECCKLVSAEVKIHYIRSNVPTVSDDFMHKKIASLHSEFRGCMKHAKKVRSNRNQVTKFKEKMDKTMPFWPRNALMVMETSKNGKLQFEKSAIDEDIQFLVSMMNDRVAQYASLDEDFTRRMAKKEERKEKDQQNALKRKQNEELRKENIKKFIGEDALDELIPDEDQDEYAGPSKESHARVVKTGTTIFIPHDILKNTALVATYTRNKVSSTAISSILHSLISICGGDTNAVNLSYSSTYR